MPPRRQQGRGHRQPYRLRPRDQNQSAQHARANRRQNPGPVQPDPVPDVQNLAPVVDPATECDHVPVSAVQKPDPAPVFPRQNHAPQVSTDQAAPPRGNTVSLDINYDNPVAQNDPLPISSFTETDVFISQTLKERVWNFEYVDLALFLRQHFENGVGQKPCSLEVLDGKLVLQQRVKKDKGYR